MMVGRHAEVALVALAERVPSSAILSQLRRTPAPTGSLALEVHRMTMCHGERDASNGDSVVVIVRDGEVVTAMLRRSWQPFTPAALRVDEVQSWPT